MRSVSSFEDVRTCINRIRSLKKGFLTNYFPEQSKVDKWCERKILWVIETEETSVFLKKDDGFTSVLYCTTNPIALSIALDQLPRGDLYVIDQIIDVRTDVSILDILKRAGFRVRKSLVRMSKINKDAFLTDVQKKYVSTVQDIPLLFSLLQDNFDKYSEQLPTLEELKDFIEAQHVIVQRVDNDIAGFIIYDQSPSTLHLRYWLVNREFRNMGIGSSLFREFQQRGQSCKRHILWVMEDNINAIMRYRHYGYNEENMKDYILMLNLN